MRGNLLILLSFIGGTNQDNLQLSRLYNLLPATFVKNPETWRQKVDFLKYMTKCFKVVL